MDKLSAPERLSLSGNVAENWTKWKMEFQIYMIATEKINKPDEVKVAILLHTAGPETIRLVKTFPVQPAEITDKYERTLEALERYCLPKANYVYERFRVASRKWRVDESVDQFVTALKTLVQGTDLSEEEQSKVIRDKIVFNLKDEQLQATLLGIADLTLEAAMLHCKTAEVTHKQVKEIRGETEVNAEEDRVVDAIKTRQLPTRRQSNSMGGSRAERVESQTNLKQLSECKWCGYTHGVRACPAYGQKCMKCSGRGHFARVCRTRQVNIVEREESNIRGEEEEFYIGAITTKQKGNPGWHEIIKVGGKEIRMKLDSGAEVNVISLERIKGILGKLRITKAPMVLCTYNKAIIKPIGKIRIKCEIRERERWVEMVVVEENVEPVLGLPTCQEWGLIQRVQEIHSINSQESTKQQLIREFKDVFTGVGKIEEEFHITLKEDAQPIIHPPRKFPYAILPKLKQELESMIQMGVIRRITEPTDWVNNILVREKKDGSLRICLDPKDLNEAMKREHHALPTVEDIATELSGKKVFNVFDMRYGFWQCPLDEGSTVLTTFNTPFGRYCFRVLPYGIKAAPEYFQRKNEEIFGDLPEVKVTFDDIITATQSESESRQAAQALLTRARERNIRFNPEKFQYNRTEVKYLGHIISGTGMRPDPDKVRAIEEMPRPRNVKDVQRILGMVTYLSPYIKNAAEMTDPLRSLTRKQNQWQWNPEQDKALRAISQALTTAPVLKYFDVTKPITLQVDASKFGLGAALLQEGRPVAYNSRLLTDTERRYAQVEKEMLAVVFGLSKFYRYVYGQDVLILTDHKPLLGLMQKELHRLSPRLQRMAMKVQKYTFHLQYIPGTQMHIADALSRAPRDKGDAEDESLEQSLDRAVHTMVMHLPLSAQKLEQFQEATRLDRTSQQLKRLMENAWEGSEDWNTETAKYWHIRHELTEVQGLLLWENRIVVPTSLRKEMLSRIHEGHIGRERMRNKARLILYWPGMAKQITALAATCETCLMHRNQQQKEPLMPHQIPERPWEKLGADIFAHKETSYLIVVDYYSKFPEVVQLTDKTGRGVVQALKSIFSRHGIPEELIADNMPFSGSEVQEFARDWEFQITTSSPHYPQSNGLSERHIQTVKKVLKKAECTRRDPYLALLELRNTPITGLEWSPAQLLMSRRLNTRLPMIRTLLEPSTCTNVQEAMRERQENTTQYHNQHARELPSIKEGDKVMIRTPHQKEWERATYVGTSKHPRSHLVETRAGNTVRRNRRHIQKGAENQELQEEKNMQLGEEIDYQVSGEGNREPGSCHPETQKAQDHTQSPIKTTRSGRTVRTPKYLSDYEQCTSEL